MTNQVVLFQARLIEIIFLTALKDALEVLSAILILMNLQMLFQITT